MRAISFKNTALFKRGVWLSAAALLVFVAGPATLNGNLWRNPLPSAIAIGILCAALSYFFWKTQIHRLADEVLDCHDSLKVSRGRVQEDLSLGNISAVEVTSQGGLHRITVRLLKPSGFGNRIDFLPQASLWSNLPAIKALAEDLSKRVHDAARAAAAGTSSS